MRLRRITRVLVFLVLGGLTLPGSHCHHHHNNSSSSATTATNDPPAQQQSVQLTVTLPVPPCNGGTGLSGGPHPQTAKETAMSNAINAYRASLGLTTLNLGHTFGEHISQWTAADMANNDYVGLVASDGEDVLQRLACSGLTWTSGGIIVVGQSANTNATLNAMIANPGMNAILTLPGPFSTNDVNVGYNNGFWMIMLH